MLQYNLIMAQIPHYFTASYIYERSTFAIFGLPHESASASVHPFYPLLCVAQNLIARGAPTPPSSALKEALGLGPAPDSARPHLVDAARAPRWDRTIKGAPDGTNPALRFWHALTEALRPDLAHLQALILPEAPLEPILQAARVPADEVAGQQVDFYCPLARLVIEVDGAQHADAHQRILDARRDELLRHGGINTLRVTTAELRSPADAVARVIAALKRGLATSEGRSVAPRAAAADADADASGTPGVPAAAEVPAIQAYELAIRIQLAVLHYLRATLVTPSVALPSEWRLSITGDAPREELQRIARAALDDAFVILANLAVLANTPFAPPRITFTSQAPDLTLDVSAFRTWDEADAQPPKGTLCIRSAHDPLRDAFHLATAPPLTYDTLALSNAATEEALRFFLQLIFGHDDFRPGQLGIIRRALARKPTLGILPTGSGKSVCYQLAALLQPAITIAVCPIISLMQDQERSLRSHGVAHVARLDSQMSTAERGRVREGLGQGRYQLIWVSPERFQDGPFRHELAQIGRTMSFGYAVVDEVHCLSEWGHDFRVSYLLLKGAFDRFCPQACLLGLTATASRDVLADLKAELGISAANIQTSPEISRPELRFHIRRTTPDTRLHDLDCILEEVAARFSLGKTAHDLFQPRGAATICGIVFANTRAGYAASKAVGCEEIKAHLIARGIPAETYHSGRAEERASIQQRFMDNEFPLMVATKSFGMGIDKSNVRFTVHANLPWSVESFYQEAGRAGRSRTNNESDCYVLYVPDPNEERTRKLFSRRTTIDEIHALQPELKGDLGTIFFLWSLGFASFSEELTRILTLLAILEQERTAQDFAVIAEDVVDDADVRTEQRGAQTEKALYKLAICGIVCDWTRNWNAGTLTVELASADGGLLQRAEAAVEAYIARHAPGFSLSDPRQAHERYVELYRSGSADVNESVASLLAMLLAWTNDTIVYARRVAIGNMLALCEANLSDEQLAAYLNGYFKLDAELENRLERVVESPADLASWLDVFYEYASTDDLAFERRLRPADQLAAIVPVADRFRESYADCIGLEWVSLLAKLLSDAFSQEDVTDQLAYVFNAAARGEGPDFDELVDETATLVAQGSAHAQAAYDNAIVDWTPDFT